jgi:hypothetical protein
VVADNYVAINTTTIDSFDIRAGKSIAGVSGKLKANCRNAIVDATYNYDGAISSIGTGVQTAGDAFDWWDTIDDFSAIATAIPTGWSNYYCNSAEDWVDVSVDSSGTSAPCSATTDDCQYKDRITGLVWSELRSTSMVWNTAMAHCGETMNATGNYNGDGPFAGRTGWRLPTQKELMVAYSHGIKGLENAKYITDVDQFFWSASSLSTLTSRAWVVHLGNGSVSNHLAKTGTSYVTCVR